MSAFDPPLYNSDVFNSGLFNTNNEYLTISMGDSRYLKLRGGTVSGITAFLAGIYVNTAFYYNGSLVDLSLLEGVIPGTVSAGKLIAVDNNLDISSFRHVGIGGNLDISNHNNFNVGLKLAGTLITSSATEINVLDGITSSTSELNILDGVTANYIEINYLDITTIGVAQASKALVLDSSRNINNINDITSTGTVSATTLTGTLSTPIQTNITNVGVLENLTVSNYIDIVNFDGYSLGLKFAGSVITSSAADLNNNDGMTLGSGAANKTLSLDNSRNVSNINDISLTGELFVNGNAKDIHITGIGSKLNISSSYGGILLSHTNSTIATYSTLSNSISTYGGYTGNKISLTNNSLTTPIANYTSTAFGTIARFNGGTPNMELDIYASSASRMAIGTKTNHQLGFYTNDAATNQLLIDTSGNIGINTSTPGKKLEIVSGSGECLRLKYNITTFTDFLLDSTGVLNITATGTAPYFQFNNNSIVNLDQNAFTSISVRNRDTTNITSGCEINFYGYRNVSQTHCIGKIKCISDAGDTADIKSGSLAFYTNDAITPYTGTGTEKLNIDKTGNVNILLHNGSIGLKLGGVLVSSSSAELNYLSGVVAGTVSASKAIVCDTNKDISSFRNLTATGIVSATTLTGTLSTAAQTNITSLGSLTGLTTAGITLGATVITATGTEINTLSGVVAGTVSASKAVVVDANKDISSFRNLTATGTYYGATSLSDSGTTITNALNVVGMNIDGVGYSFRQFNGTLKVGMWNNGSTAGLGTISTNDYRFYTDNASRIRIASSGEVIFLSTTAASSSITGAIQIAGGVGIVKDLYVGASIIGGSAAASTSSSTGGLRLSSGIATTKNTDSVSSTNGGSMTLAGGAAIAKTLYVGGNVVLPSVAAGTTSMLILDDQGGGVGSNAIYSSGYNTPITLDVGQGGTLSYVKVYNGLKSNGSLLQLETSSNVLRFEYNLNVSSRGDTFDMTTTDAHIGISCNGATTTPLMFFDKTNTNIGISNVNPNVNYKMDMTSLRCGTNLGIGLTSAGAAHIDILNTATYTSGNYNKSLRIKNQNATPIIFELQMNKNATGAGNISYMGTTTNDSLCVMTNDIGRILVNEVGSVVIGDVTVVNAFATCYINGAQSALNIDHFGLGVALARATIGYTLTTGPISGVNLSLKTSGSVLIGGTLYITSDARKKKKIKVLDVEYCRRILEIDSVSYEMSNGISNIGFIAQDVVKCGLNELLNVIPNPDIKKSCDYDVDGLEYSLDYQKIAVVQNTLIRELYEDNNEIIDQLNTLTTENQLLQSRFNELEKKVEKLIGKL
jgi:hypothetical protein